MTSQNPAILELCHLVKDFDTKRAVDNVSFSLQRGQILGLLGPNGAGKTTTIRMIMNIIAPDSGEIRILGESFSEALKDRIGYLPEERGLYRKMTIDQNLDFFGRLKGMDRKTIFPRSSELLEKFDLIRHRGQRMEELSKGMGQKLQFIVAILHAPDLLILDEPFSGLDPVNIEKVKDTILELKRSGISVIFSTHLMAYAEKIVDTVVMIHEGRKVLDGPLSRIQAQHGRRLARIIYDGDGGFVSQLDYVRHVSDYGREMEIELAGDNQRQQLLRDLVTRLDIHHFEMSDPSLHNIFLRQVDSKSSVTADPDERP
ncbi:MAG: ATP-binding cassette domain-containing protein [Acidobacteriota bacterium]|jgi:ABC-2 type transport system ATP-binding protein|nr:ATP-binding cassette domain-containing protein [Acidobacteriota bacterium]